MDFLEKPVRAAELLACVQHGLARSQQSRGERAERAAVERRFATLTPRERDVLWLLLTGRLTKQIAGELGIAEKTAKIHRGHVMHKYGGGLRRPACPDGPEARAAPAPGPEGERALPRPKAL